MSKLFSQKEVTSMLMRVFRWTKTYRSNAMQQSPSWEANGP